MSGRRLGKRDPGGEVSHPPGRIVSHALQESSESHRQMQKGGQEDAGAAPPPPPPLRQYISVPRKTSLPVERLSERRPADEDGCVWLG